MGFDKEIFKKRKAANLTQERLAELCGVSRQAVQKWEKGEALPDVYLIANMAKLFDCSVEDLIWSKDIVVLENKHYYIRKLEESDKEDFCLLMRKHRYMGELLKAIDTMDKMSQVDDIYWKNYLCGGETYVIYRKGSNEFAGYLYFEGINTNSPDMSMQLNEEKFTSDDFSVLRDFLNWVNTEFGLRAIHVYVNSKIERELFEYLGFKDVKDEVMLVLPV